MFIYSVSKKEGWFYTKTFDVYQKVNKDVYCYVSICFGFYKLQMYERGTASFCILEARSKDNIEKLFALGEQWLKEYEQWEMEHISNNIHYIGKSNWSDNCWI